ncbi:inactive serine/threonine-protein kinase TEX14-like isoform X2 [Rhinatrema bivittatum]|nr:inactive serine/threonine-protein kinase TEX14-like isoform X2 [Rhinatrema bivittatum]
MWKIQLLPAHCPTELGHVKDQDSATAHLLCYAIKGRGRKVKRLLKQGTDVELQNSAGQTALYLSALVGLNDVVEILLHFRADVNHRCKDGSTPVHAAAFSCRGSLLLQLLSAGGDLRLHDQEGRTPQDWANAAGSEKNAEVLQCMRQYETQISLMFQCSSDSAIIQIQQRMRSSSLRSLGSLSSLLLSPLQLLSLSRSRGLLRKSQQALEKLCIGGILCSGLMTSTPVVAEIELLQADSERDQTYESGPYTLMRNLLWRGQFVTVRELKPPSHLGSNRPSGIIDLLITEQQYCSHLHHPNLLLLMAVCLSQDLRLVYERVEVGSLYCLLHRKRSEFPVLQYEMIIRLLLQVCEALMFLHSQGFVHRSTTSHAVHIVTMSSAKLSNLEYMQLSEEKAKGNNWSPPIPPQLYNWLPLEVMQDRPTTSKSDCYSFCAIIQEIFTDTVPWNHADGLSVKEMMESGCSLAADSQVPQPYYLAVKTDLSLRARDRTISLPDIRYILRKDLRETLSSFRIPRFRDRSAPVLGLCLEVNQSCREQQDMTNGNIPTPEPCVLGEPSQKSKVSDLLYYEIDTDSSMSSSERISNNLHCREQDRWGCTVTDTGIGHSNKQQEVLSHRGIPSHQKTAHSFSTTSSLKSHCEAEVKNSLCKPSSTNSSPQFTLLLEQQGPQAYDSSKISTNSEGSLILEVTTEESQMDPSSTKTFCEDIVGTEVQDISVCHPSDSASLCQNNFLSSLKESASLLEKANTSLECLERRFLTSIDTLQEFASYTTLSPSSGARSRQQLRHHKREFVATTQQKFAAEIKKGIALSAGSVATDIASESERKPEAGEDMVDTVSSEKCEEYSRRVAGLSLPSSDPHPRMCYQSVSQLCKKLEPNPAVRCCISTMMSAQSEEILPRLTGHMPGMAEKEEACKHQKTPYKCCALTEKEKKGSRPQRCLSLQSIIDLSSRARVMQRDKIQNANKQGPEDNSSATGFSKKTIWLSPKLSEQNGDDLLKQIES